METGQLPQQPSAKTQHRLTVPDEPARQPSSLESSFSSGEAPVSTLNQRTPQSTPPERSDGLRGESFFPSTGQFNYMHNPSDAEPELVATPPPSMHQPRESEDETIADNSIPEECIRVVPPRVQHTPSDNRFIRSCEPCLQSVILRYSGESLESQIRVLNEIRNLLCNLSVPFHYVKRKGDNPKKGVEWIQCLLCQKTFRCPNPTPNYAAHLLPFHFGIKAPFACSDTFCPKTFVRSHDRDKHEREAHKRHRPRSYKWKEDRQIVPRKARARAKCPPRPTTEEAEPSQAFQSSGPSTSSSARISSSTNGMPVGPTPSGSTVHTRPPSYIAPHAPSQHFTHRANGTPHLDPVRSSSWVAFGGHTLSVETLIYQREPRYPIGPPTPSLRGPHAITASISNRPASDVYGVADSHLSQSFSEAPITRNNYSLFNEPYGTQPVPSGSTGFIPPFSTQRGLSHNSHLERGTGSMYNLSQQPRATLRYPPQPMAPQPMAHRPLPSFHEMRPMSINGPNHLQWPNQPPHHHSPSLSHTVGYGANTDYDPGPIYHRSEQPPQTGLYPFDPSHVINQRLSSRSPNPIPTPPGSATTSVRGPTHWTQQQIMHFNRQDSSRGFQQDDPHDQPEQSTQSPRGHYRGRLAGQGHWGTRLHALLKSLLQIGMRDLRHVFERAFK